LAGRLEGRYGLAVALALLGLCPEIVLGTASLPLGPVVSADLGSSTLQLQLANGLSNAGYAFGAVLAAQLAQRYVARHLFLTYEALFVLASVLAATASTAGVFVTGRVLQGTATGLMLIAALPPRAGAGSSGPPPWPEPWVGSPRGSATSGSTHWTPTCRSTGRR
jgi:MFS family permease